MAKPEIENFDLELNIGGKGDFFSKNGISHKNAASCIELRMHSKIFLDQIEVIFSIRLFWPRKFSKNPYFYSLRFEV